MIDELKIALEDDYLFVSFISLMALMFFAVASVFTNTDPDASLLILTILCIGINVPIILFFRTLTKDLETGRLDSS